MLVKDIYLVWDGKGRTVACEDFSGSCPAKLIPVKMHFRIYEDDTKRPETSVCYNVFCEDGTYRFYDTYEDAQEELQRLPILWDRNECDGIPNSVHTYPFVKKYEIK